MDAGKVAVFLADGFEEIEALTVVDLLRRAEIETLTVKVPFSMIGDGTAPREGAPSDETGMVCGSHGIAVEADEILDHFSFADTGMIVLPGGMPGTKNLEACEALMEQVRAFDREKKRVAAICAAPGILGRMGMLAERRALSHPSVAADLKGAQTAAGLQAVTDDHLTTSRGMGTAIAFALEIITQIKGKECADTLSSAICYGT